MRRWPIRRKFRRFDMARAEIVRTGPVLVRTPGNSRFAFSAQKIEPCQEI
jgi:hypothetical protein